MGAHSPFCAGAGLDATAHTLDPEPRCRIVHEACATGLRNDARCAYSRQGVARPPTAFPGTAGLCSPDRDRWSVLMAAGLVGAGG